MSFLGSGTEFKPGWKPGPRWKQRWWWRERIPGLVAAAVLATLMGLAGWLPFYFNDRGDDPPAHPHDTASGEPRSSAPTGPSRPTEQPPQLPDAAHKPTVEGIEATIRFEIDAINYAQRTGDLEPVKTVYNMNSCKFCELLVEKLSASLKNGAKYVDAEYSIRAINARTSIGNNGEVLGDAIVSQAQPKEGILLGSNGRELERRPADLEINTNYALNFVFSRWILQDESSRKSS